MIQNVFQYLPNFARASSVEASVPWSVHRTDQGKEQRLTNALSEAISYGDYDYYTLTTVRRYSAEYSSIGSITDSSIFSRLQALRNDTVLLPVFIEPLAATTDLQGLTTFSVDPDKEFALTQIKFFMPHIVRLDLADRDFFEAVNVTSSISSMLSTGQITVDEAWAASIPPSRCRLYFADTVYQNKTVRQDFDSDQVRHVLVEWASI